MYYRKFECYIAFHRNMGLSHIFNRLKNSERLSKQLWLHSISAKIRARVWGGHCPFLDSTTDMWVLINLWWLEMIIWFHTLSCVAVPPDFYHHSAVNHCKYCLRWNNTEHRRFVAMATARVGSDISEELKLNGIYLNQWSFLLDCWACFCSECTKVHQ